MYILFFIEMGCGPSGTLRRILLTFSPELKFLCRFVVSLDFPVHWAMCPSPAYRGPFTHAGPLRVENQLRVLEDPSTVRRRLSEN